MVPKPIRFSSHMVPKMLVFWAPCGLKLYHTIVHASQAVVGYLDNVGLLTANATLRKVNLDLMESLHS